MRFKIDVTEVVILCRQPPDDDVIDWFEHWRVSDFEAATDESLTLLLLRMEHLERISGSERRPLTRVPLAAGSANPRWYGQEPGASKGLD